jgi:predicted pyridoxine 5'-phosphate oxidase superfamily flavin-nucleotide-binding protein
MSEPVDTGTSTIFHEGELAVQERAGALVMASRVGRGIRTEVPAIVATFLGTQCMAFVGTLDADGRPWASVLTGPAGFARSPNEHTVLIAATPTPGDPIIENLGSRAGAAAEQPWSAPVGVLVVDFMTHRRLRVNGRGTLRTVGEPHGGLRDGLRREGERELQRELYIEVEQVYSNCHKHIQTRAIDDDTPPIHSEAARVQRNRGLSDAQRDWIRRADTFAIASAHPTAGTDCSHRGGTPGFVHVDGDRLTWPDYVGNSLFNTLGNITAYPRAGVIFVDFDSGATLQLTGCAAVDWDAEHAASVPGAQRLVMFDVDEAIEVSCAVPFHFRLIERSRFNPPPWPERLLARTG